MVRYITAGESHGKALTVIVDGIPAGLALTEADINGDLARRQKGYGRGARMQRIEKDTVEITAGLRWGRTLGSPIALVVKNKDWNNHIMMMSLDRNARDETRYQTLPRPGHADLAGMIKFDTDDARDILERASARETAVRVAAGAVCRKLLACFGIDVFSWTVSIGGVSAPLDNRTARIDRSTVENSPVRCPHARTEKKIIRAIKAASKRGDTLGGVFQVRAGHVPVGLGSCMQWDKRLDGRLAAALMSIPAIKGVEIGIGFRASSLPGSKVHDVIRSAKNKGIYRSTNNAGGIEGGMSNGEDIIVRAAMKPIATLKNPLASVDIRTGVASRATVVRSDICAVPAAGIIGEAVVCIELANVLQEKFGGDSMPELLRNFSSYIKKANKKLRK